MDVSGHFRNHGGLAGCAEADYLRRWGAEMDYESDAIKATSNLAKHGTSFLAAAEAPRDDPHKLEDADLSEDYGEERNQVLCLYKGMVVLFVVTTEPEEGTCRIISARRADRDEQARYWKNHPLSR